jgi:hypothetical protein
MVDRDYELLKKYLGEEKLGELEVSIFNGFFDGLDSITEKNKTFEALLRDSPGLKEYIRLSYRKSYFKEMVFQIARYARINNLSCQEVSAELIDFQIPTAKDIYDDVCEDKTSKKLCSKIH